MKGCCTKIFILMIAYIGWEYPVFSQPIFKAEYYFMENGLPSNSIQSCTMDSAGYLWLGTNKGICKYDGFFFQVLPKAKEQCLSMAATTEGKLFFFNSTGLNHFNPYTSAYEVISAVNFSDTDPDNDHYDNIFADEGGRVWCNDFKNVKYYAKGKHVVKSFQISKYNGNTYNLARFCSPAKDQVWAATLNGLYLWNSRDDSLTRCPNPELSRLTYSACMKLGNDSLVLASGNIVYLVQASKNKILKKIKIDAGKEEKIISLSIFLRNNKKYIAAATHGQLFFSDELLNDFFPAFTIGANIGTINSVYIPVKSNHAWICTTNGFIKLTPDNEAIVNYQLPASEKHEDNVTAIIKAITPGFFFIGTSGGHFYYTNLRNQWKNIPIPSQPGINHLSYCNNTILLSTKNGLYQYDHGIKKIHINETYDNTSIVKAKVTETHIWLLTNNLPVIVLNRINYKPSSGIIVKNNAIFSLNNRWNDIAADRNGNIFLAGWIPDGYGLAEYNPDSAAFEAISNRTHDAYLFMGSYYLHVSESDQFNLLFSGYGGFNIVNEQGAVIKKVDYIKYPIINPGVQGIVSMKDSSVWFGTLDGIQMWDQHTDQLLLFTTFNGLPFNNAVFAFEPVAEDIIAVGFNKALSLINTRKIVKTEPVTKLVWSKITVNNIEKPILNNQIILFPNERNIRLNFSALNFSDKYNLQYWYRINGSEWQALARNPELSLSNFNSGNYLLDVKVVNILLPQQAKITKLQIIAQPFIYETNWFKFLCAAILGLLVYVLVRRRVFNIRKEASVKQKITETEIAALKAQMNPHFIFNCINSIDALIQSNDKYNATNYLNKFAKLIRNVLDSSKENVVPFSKDAETLQLYIELEKLRSENKFTSSVTISEELLNSDYKVPPLIVQPFVENAIHHGLRNNEGNKGILKINVERIEDKICYIISDNGIGREAAGKINSHQHQSYGMQMSYDRIKMFNNEETASVKINDLYENNRPSGTKVTVQLQIK